MFCFKSLSRWLKGSSSKRSDGFIDKLFNEDAVSIRPHQIKLVTSKSLKYKTAIDGKIISKKFYGSFQEIIVKSEDLSLAIHLEPKRKINIGDKIKFCMDL